MDIFNSANILLGTNAYESFHLFFNDGFYSNSPSIIIRPNIVRNYIQTYTYIKINSVEVGTYQRHKTMQIQFKSQEHDRKQITRYRSNAIEFTTSSLKVCVIIFLNNYNNGKFL